MAETLICDDESRLVVTDESLSHDCARAAERGVEMVDSRKIKRMVKRAKYLKWHFPQCTSVFSNSKKHCTRQETILPSATGGRGTTAVKKGKGRITAQFESCFRQFVDGYDIKRQCSSKQYQYRDLGHEELDRNNRPKEQSHNNDDDQVDHDHLTRAVDLDQAQYKPNRARGIHENNTSTNDKPISLDGSSEVILNGRVSKSDDCGRTFQVQDSASERSFFGEFVKHLDSFKNTFATSSCQDKTFERSHTSTVSVANRSNKPPKRPGTPVADSSTRVPVRKSMKSDTKVTVNMNVRVGKSNETVRNVTKGTICIDKKVVIVQEKCKSTSDNRFTHSNTLKEDKISEKKPIIRNVIGKRKNLDKTCSMQTSERNAISTKSLGEKASKGLHDPKGTTAEMMCLPPKKRFCSKNNLSPTKSTSPTDALKSILKSPRSTFKHGDLSRERSVYFSELVCVALIDKEQGLITTSERPPTKSDDVMKQISQPSSRKRSRPELTGAQVSLFTIVKRLKTERMNGKKDTEEVKAIPNSNPVPRASLLSKHFQGKRLTVQIDALHKKLKSVSVLVSPKKDSTSNVSNNSSSGQQSHAVSTKGVVADTSICKPRRETPPAKSIAKGREIPSCKVYNSETAADKTHDNTSSRPSVARTKLTRVRLFCCDHCNKKFISPAKLEAHKPIHYTSRPSAEFGSDVYSPAMALDANTMTEFKNETLEVLMNEFEEWEGSKRDGSRCATLKEVEHAQEKHLENHSVMQDKIDTTQAAVHIRVDDDTQTGKELNDIHDLENVQHSDITCAREKITHVMKHCTHCNRVFKNLDNLERHERAHSMERKHACVYCKETFSLSSERNKHELTHGIEETCCCSCEE